jgi:serralysin
MSNIHVHSCDCAQCHQAPDPTAPEGNALTTSNQLSGGAASIASISALDSGHVWANNTVTYTFNDADGNISFSDDELSSINLFNTDQSNAARAVFQQIEAFTNLNVDETSGEANITLRAADMNGGIAGYAYFPNEFYGSDLFIDNNYNSANVSTHEGYYSLAPGNFGFLLLLHEIGHTLGLDHPHGGSGTLSTADDSVNATVMSYVSSTSANTGGLAATSVGPTSPTTYQILDIAALQALYGTNNSYNAGDNTYNLTGETTVYTIWDGNGTDTLNASAYTGNSVIDLREGLENVTTVGGTKVWVAYNANIENATGGSGNDVIYGNSGNNAIRGGSGADNISGNEGDDWFNGNAGTDSISGDSGNDTVRGGKESDILFGNSGNDFVNGNNDNDTVNGGSGNDTLHGGKNDDIIISGSGDDIIFGDLGNDTLTGDSGADVFVFKSDAGNDTITDFTVGTDKIEFRGSDISAESILASLSTQSDGVHIAIADGTELIISGLNSLSLSDFDFV